MKWLLLSLVASSAWSCSTPPATVKVTRTPGGKEIIEVRIPQTAILHGPNIALGLPMLP